MWWNGASASAARRSLVPSSNPVVRFCHFGSLHSSRSTPAAAHRVAGRGLGNTLGRPVRSGGDRRTDGGRARLARAAVRAPARRSRSPRWHFSQHPDGVPRPVHRGGIRHPAGGKRRLGDRPSHLGRATGIGHRRGIGAGLAPDLGGGRRRSRPAERSLRHRPPDRRPVRRLRQQPPADDPAVGSRTRWRRHAR